MRVQGRVTFDELTPELRKRLGLPPLTPETSEREAYKLLAGLYKYDKEQRWHVLHRALQVDGGEPAPPQPPPPFSLWAWLKKELWD